MDTTDSAALARIGRQMAGMTAEIDRLRAENAAYKKEEAEYDMPPDALVHQLRAENAELREGSDIAFLQRLADDAEGFHIFFGDDLRAWFIEVGSEPGQMERFFDPTLAGVLKLARKAWGDDFPPEAAREPLEERTDG